MLEDEFHPQPRDNVTEVISWATPMGVVYAMFGGGIALAIASIIAPTEPAGRFLLALAVIGLFVMGGLALRQRPRLAVIEDAGTKSIAVQRLRARRIGHLIADLDGEVGHAHHQHHIHPSDRDQVHFFLWKF